MSVDHRVPGDIMTPETYRALRESLGSRKRAAKLLGCSETAIRNRESPISVEAARRLQDAVYAIAEVENAKWERRRERRLAQFAEAPITPSQFRAACERLRWLTYAEASRQLWGDETAAQWVSRWAQGASPIPWWVARDVRAALELTWDDPLPEEEEDL